MSTLIRTTYCGGSSINHRDPFDRMLIAQAMVEGFTVITHDRIFERYEVKIISA